MSLSNPEPTAEEVARATEQAIEEIISADNDGFTASDLMLLKEAQIVTE